jgi:hypothetical protein
MTDLLTYRSLWEDPGLLETPFPNFGSTHFYNTYAYSGTLQNLSNCGTTIILVDSKSNPVDQVVDETPTSFMVVYEGV